MEIATLAGGCFWCLEAVFLEVRGVGAVRSGYMGGSVASPTYEAVCSGSTGHAEVVQIEFDPTLVTFRELLDVFFTIHDPTTLNRQGNDIGTQYRSAIFFHSEAQREAAAAAIRELEACRAHRDPIVTQLAPAGEFWEAEPYHQNYFASHPYQPYCQFVVAPKVSKFRSKFASFRAVPQ